MTAPLRIPVTALDEAFVHLAESTVMSVHFEVKVAGAFDADRLSEALRQATALHPLSRARLLPTSLSTTRMTWEITDVPDHLALEITAEPAEEVRNRLQSLAPNLEASPPFLASLVREADGDRLILNFHHAAFDGMSAVRFTTSIARAYADQDDKAGGPSLETARDLRKLRGSRGLKDLKPRVAKVGKDITQRLSITRVGPDGADPQGRAGVATLYLTPGEVARISQARPQGATLNDVAIAAHALTIKTWNEEHRVKVADSISVMMPVNLRPAEWSQEVISNFASYLAVFVPGDIGDLTSATKLVRDETGPLKDNGAAAWLVDILEPGNLLPTVVKKNLQRMLPLVERQFVETTTVSNLGRLSFPAFGEAGEVTEVWFSPPTMSATIPIALGVAGLDGGLFLAFRGNHKMLSQDAIERFAQTYKDVLLG